MNFRDLVEVIQLAKHFNRPMLVNITYIFEPNGAELPTTAGSKYEL